MALKGGYCIGNEYMQRGMQLATAALQFESMNFRKMTDFYYDQMS